MLRYAEPHERNRPRFRFSAGSRDRFNRAAPSNEHGGNYLQCSDTSGDFNDLVARRWNGHVECTPSRCFLLFLGGGFLLLVFTYDWVLYFTKVYRTILTFRFWWNFEDLSSFDLEDADSVAFCGFGRKLESFQTVQKVKVNLCEVSTIRCLLRNYWMNREVFRRNFLGIRGRVTRCTGRWGKINSKVGESRGKTIVRVTCTFSCYAFNRRYVYNRYRIATRERNLRRSVEFEIKIVRCIVFSKMFRTGVVEIETDTCNV